MLLATVLWGVATAILLWDYPQSNPLMSFISMGYLILYTGISLYRTWVPLTPQAKTPPLQSVKTKRPQAIMKKRARS
jgi:hypothetical protein